MRRYSSGFTRSVSAEQTLRFLFIFTGRYNVDDEELPALTDVVAHQHSLVTTELSMDGASDY
jgi:hypothetical protein